MVLKPRFSSVRVAKSAKFQFNIQTRGLSLNIESKTLPVR